MFRYDLVIAAPNSAIDSYYDLAEFQVGQVNKAVHAFHTAGGKGFNAARALQRLGGRAFCVGIVAGKAGEFIEKELDREEISHDLVWGEGESRRCATIRFPGPPDTTVILENGPQASQEVVRRFAHSILAHANDAPFTALAGSLPEGFPTDFYQSVIRGLKEKNTRVCIDCSGTTLSKAVEAGPWMIKVNRGEFQTAFFENSAQIRWQDVQTVYRDLNARGVEILIITNDRDGAYLLSSDRNLIHVVTNVQGIVSSAGSGDTFLASFLLALGRKESIEKAAAYASAAAAANLLELGCGFFQANAVNELLSATRMDQIPWS